MPDSQLCVQRRDTDGQQGETVNNKPVLLPKGVAYYTLFFHEDLDNTKHVCPNWDVCLSDKALTVPSACGWSRYWDFEQC